MQLFAHETAAAQSNPASTFLENPLAAVLFMTLLVGALMYWAVYLLKHHAAYKFPYNPKQGEK